MGFSVLAIFLDGFFVFWHLVFRFRRRYWRFFGFAIRCGFWAFLICPICGFRFCPNFYAVLDDFFFGFAVSNIPQRPPHKEQICQKTNRSIC